VALLSGVPRAARKPRRAGLPQLAARFRRSLRSLCAVLASPGEQSSPEPAARRAADAGLRSVRRPFRSHPQPHTSPADSLPPYGRSLIPRTMLSRPEPRQRAPEVCSRSTRVRLKRGDFLLLGVSDPGSALTTIRQKNGRSCVSGRLTRSCRVRRRTGRRSRCPRRRRPRRRCGRWCGGGPRRRRRRSGTAGRSRRSARRAGPC
jgi:hypothetical protein